MSKRKKNKEEKRLLMLQAAARVFSAQGIDTTTIQQIADRAGVGVASVYRYFPGKIDIAIAVAIDYWQQYMTSLFTQSNLEMDKAIEMYMNNFLILLREAPDFFRYIENFDNYMSRQNVRPESFSHYEDLLAQHDQQFIELLIKGQKENLIRIDIDVKHFYSVATKSIMALAQKNLLRGNVLSSDVTDTQSEEELKTLINIFYNSIKGENLYEKN